MREEVATPARRVESAAAAPESTPLTDSTRRFLRPLVGVDPNTVRVYRGVDGGQLASRRHADALTIGDDVVLPPTHAEREPETLGLVAHELTHVARRRDPTFVPPMLQGAASASGAARRPIRGGESSQGASAGAPEESMALAVESGVRTAAKAATGGASSPLLGAHAVEPPVASMGDDTPKRVYPPRDRRWGTLPAPWEPIPELQDLVSPAPTGSRETALAVAASATTLSGRSAQDSGFESETHRRTGPTNAREGAAPVGAGHDAAPAGEVWHADTGRTIEPAPESAATTHAAPGGEKPKADIDGLAQQVYAILKRRLAAEQRRGA
jgi:hypothetical protein